MSLPLARLLWVCVEIGSKEDSIMIVKGIEVCYILSDLNLKHL